MACRALNASVLHCSLQGRHAPARASRWPLKLSGHPLRQTTVLAGPGAICSRPATSGFVVNPHGQLARSAIPPHAAAPGAQGGYTSAQGLITPHWATPSQDSMGSETLDSFDVFDGYVPEPVKGALSLRPHQHASILNPDSINPSLRILLVSSAFNGMTQRTKVHLEQEGHLVSVQLFTSADDVQSAVQRFVPDVVICPFLKDFLPASVYEACTCLVVHPGVMGDKGPSSLDWAILEGKSCWGVTVLQAVEGADAGPVWASVSFNIPNVGTKSNIYNTAAADAALSAIQMAVRQCQLVRKQVGWVQPKPHWPVLPHLAGGDVADGCSVAPAGGPYTTAPCTLLSNGSWNAGVAWAFQLAGQAQEYGCNKPLMQQQDRRIDWAADTTDVIVRKIRAADGQPGVRDSLMGMSVYMCGATHEDTLRGNPKDILATRNGAVCLGTIDGAVWVSHLRRVGSKSSAATYFKLPAVMVLGQEALWQAGVSEVPGSIDVTGEQGRTTFRDIWYEQQGAVGLLHFPFYNGAAGTEQLRRLRDAFAYARSNSSTSSIVLAGGPYCWSNGIHLNVIEASEEPAQEAWDNINAMDDLVHDIITCDSHLTISAVQGNAGAGGVYLAMAADYVMAHEGAVLNPHYKSMGLFGSEFWTYLSSRRLSPQAAANVTDACLPLMASQAWQLGMLDEVVRGARPATLQQAVLRGQAFARPEHFNNLMAIKADRRAVDEAQKPLASYRQEELQQMMENMMNNNWGFHEKRRAFVYKKKPLATCPAIALHSR